MEPARRIDRLFAAQHGVISLADACDAGFTQGQIRHMVGSGRWHRKARGVFRLCAAPRTPHQRLMVAVLAGPPGTVASHLSAAWLLGALSSAAPGPGSEIHVTVPRGASGRRLLTAAHRGTLRLRDRTRVSGIPCSSGARTALDCAALLDVEALGELVDALILLRRTSPDRIAETLAAGARSPGRRGEARLRRVLELWSDPIRPGSLAEMRLLRRLAAWGLPPAATQFEVRDAGGGFLGRIDVAWPDQRLGLEYDGRQWHGPRRLEHDEHRQAALEAAGWHLERADRTDVAAGQDRFRRRLTEQLRKRGAA